jgi:hypothetical protein
MPTIEKEYPEYLAVSIPTTDWLTKHCENLVIPNKWYLVTKMDSDKPNSALYNLIDESGYKQCIKVDGCAFLDGRAWITKPFYTVQEKVEHFIATSEIIHDAIMGLLMASVVAATAILVYWFQTKAIGL